ncbi:MAG: hypothetical protein ACKPKO_42345, partial [Candidatus Fonsibacter sp.]
QPKGLVRETSWLSRYVTNSKRGRGKFSNIAQTVTSDTAENELSLVRILGMRFVVQRQLFTTTACERSNIPKR